MLNWTVEEALRHDALRAYQGQVQLILTSPPFPLRRKKAYGNLEGERYVEWLRELAKDLHRLLKPDGSLVVEIGNAWEPGQPTMSTLPVEALLAIKEAGPFYVCQQFVCHNPARLPGPAQWVNIERTRVKDSFTHIWWFGRSSRPKADNRQVLLPYSASMKRLLKSKSYNAGPRPSEHDIPSESFLKDNGGAIPPSAINTDDLHSFLEFANTASNDAYLQIVREKNLKLHPARMPMKLAEFFVKFLTAESDLVVDPFSGSNTTGFVAEHLNRQWLSIEPDRQYVEASSHRFDDLRSSTID